MCASACMCASAHKCPSVYICVRMHAPMYMCASLYICAEGVHGTIYMVHALLTGLPGEIVSGFILQIRLFYLTPINHAFPFLTTPAGQ